MQQLDGTPGGAAAIAADFDDAGYGGSLPSDILEDRPLPGALIDCLFVCFASFLIDRSTGVLGWLV